jgi:hypothetical protein
LISLQGNPSIPPYLQYSNWTISTVLKKEGIDFFDSAILSIGRGFKIYTLITGELGLLPENL